MSDQSSLPPELNELIACERELPAGTDDDRRRIGIRLGATLGLGAAVGGAATSAAAATTSAAAGTAVKIIAIVLAIGAIGGGTALLVHRSTEPARSELARPPAPKPSTAQVLPSAPVPDPPATAEAPPPTGSSSAPPPTAVPSAPRPNRPTDVLVVADWLHVAERGVGTNDGRILRVQRPTSSVTMPFEVVASGIDAPTRLAADATSIYWWSPAVGIQRTSLSPRGSVEMVMSTGWQYVNYPFAIAVRDANYDVAWRDPENPNFPLVFDEQK
jgi:hypothetical protein